jgi:uncharacterized protein (DUF58 family)
MTDNSNAIRLAFFTAVIHVTALTVGISLLFYLAYVLWGVLLAAFIWAQLHRRWITVRRTVSPPQAQVGQIVEETIEIRNESWLRKLWLELRDHSTLQGHHFAAVVSLPRKSTREWKVRTLCRQRGLYRLGPTAIHTGDPFGLFNSVRMYPAQNDLLVLPPTMPLDKLGLPASDLPGGNRMARRAFHSTPNAAGIREYMPGDPMNRIHWPITARVQRLMVKEFELDPTSDIWIALDLDGSVHVTPTQSAELGAQPVENGQSFGETRRPGQSQTQSAVNSGLALDPTTEEYAIVTASSLAAHFLAQGRTVGLIAWGQHRVTLTADRGGRQLVKILRALAVLRAEGRTPLHAVLETEQLLFSRPDTLIVVTPSLHEEWVEALQMQMFRGISSVAALVEPGTFGGEGNPMVTVSALASINVPTFLIKRDAALDISLAHSVAGLGRGGRNLR